MKCKEIKKTTLFLVLGIFLIRTSQAEIEIREEDRCKPPKAMDILTNAMNLQLELETKSALGKYKECLKLEPLCQGCLYKMGWSYWKQGEWDEVIKTWTKLLKLAPYHPKATQYLATARENKKIVAAGESTSQFRKAVPLDTESLPKDAPIKLVFVSRRQSYNSKATHPLDNYDTKINSPKSVRFSEDGKFVYVNSLEGGKTIKYDALGFEQLAVIEHKFTSKESKLFSKTLKFGYKFPKKIKEPNHFTGKPVELELTHNGKYLWVPYYRRDYDKNSSYPSALAVIDTKRNQIVRVLPTGPIPKYVRASPKGSYLAVSHWGDNTVGLFDIQSDSVKSFSALSLLVVEEQLKLEGLKGDRDRNCGFCVRGLAFSPDEKYLFVSRMRKGGIAAFDLSHPQKPVYLGSVHGINPGPRDLEITKDAKWFYSSCNASGYVSKVPMKNLFL